MAACSAAPQPFYQLSQHSPLEQYLDDEETTFSMPLRPPVKCSDAWSSLCCSYSENMELSTTRSGRLSAPLLLPSPEEIKFSIPPRSLLQCSDVWSPLCCSYSRKMELSPSRQLWQNSRHRQDAEIMSEFCLRAPVLCSEDLSVEQFADFSTEEVNFDKAKSELVCSSSNR